MNDTIAIIGGGWAGCAAALALARGGRRVALYEAAPTLGGRARAVSRDSLALDNGQHLLLGAYVETLRMLELVHGNVAPVIARSALRIAPLASSQANALTLAASEMRPPFGLLIGLLTARGLGVGERMATIGGLLRWKRGGWRCDPQLTVEELLADLPANVVRKLWEPLCLAALNTPIARASGQVFLNVACAAFDTSPGAADLLLAREHLSAVFPDAAARWLVAHGHAVHLRTTAVVVEAGTECVTLQAEGTTVAAPAVVVAVGPHQLAHAFDPALPARVTTLAEAVALTARLRYESITTVYLGYDTPIAIGSGLVRLDDAPGQWVFVRPDILASRSASATPVLKTLLAVVISANGPHDHRPHAALAHECDEQLRRLEPRLPPCVWSQVIAERRATYACTPDAARPRGGAVAPNVYLAGDYTDPEFPATLEAAVRSGRRAAEALMASR